MASSASFLNDGAAQNWRIISIDLASWRFFDGTLVSWDIPPNSRSASRGFLKASIFVSKKKWKLILLHKLQLGWGMETQIICFSRKNNIAESGNDVSVCALKFLTSKVKLGERHFLEILGEVRWGEKYSPKFTHGWKWVKANFWKF
mgnify:CR=1 FL=1